MELLLMGKSWRDDWYALPGRAKLDFIGAVVFIAACFVLAILIAFW